MYIYIMGRAHNGSTFLDILLGNSSQIESLGEVVSGLSRADREVCACGVIMSHCPFWQEVRSRVEAQGITWQELCTLSVDQIDLLKLWRTFRTDISDNELLRLLAATRALEQAVGETSGKAHLVDSNKAVTRALFLLRFHPEARVIYLVRNPLDTLRSHFWRIQAGYTLFFQRRRYSARWFGMPYLVLSGLSWTVGNLLAELVACMAPDQVIRVRYEDLQARPDQELARVGAALGIDLADVRAKLLARAPLSVGHNVGGNEIRTKGAVTFDPQKPARRPLLPQWLQALTLATCWPLMPRYGYKISRQPTRFRSRQDRPLAD